MSKKSKSESLPWDEVEQAIKEEIRWLQETITDSPFQQDTCKKCIFRQIAVLILSGKVRATDIKSKVCLWGEDSSFPIGKTHGQEWHSEMMKLVATYFDSLKYEVLAEPDLRFGRADLGAYKKGKRNLFIEVGTVSISKLLSNLQSMADTDILIVLNSNHAVEFSVLKTDIFDRLARETHRSSSG